MWEVPEALDNDYGAGVGDVHVILLLESGFVLQFVLGVQRSGPPESFDQKVLNFFLRLTEIVLGVHDPVLLHF